MDEHRESKESRDSLDVINDAIIKNTFLGYTGNSATVERNDNSINLAKEKTEEDDDDCCSNACFKWWFFHSSFQIPSKTDDIKSDLLNQRKQFYCCDVCSECLEVKLLNYCASSKCASINGCIKEHCSECFYNGCQLSCCCFTFILTSK